MIMEEERRPLRSRSGGAGPEAGGTGRAETGTGKAEMSAGAEAACAAVGSPMMVLVVERAGESGTTCSLSLSEQPVLVPVLALLLAFGWAANEYEEFAVGEVAATAAATAAVAIAATAEAVGELVAVRASEDADTDADAVAGVTAAAAVACGTIRGGTGVWRRSCFLRGLELVLSLPEPVGAW
jgi:hypothetical protein